MKHLNLFRYEIDFILNGSSGLVGQNISRCISNFLRLLDIPLRATVFLPTIRGSMVSEVAQVYESRKYVVEQIAPYECS